MTSPKIASYILGLKLIRYVEWKLNHENNYLTFCCEFVICFGVRVSLIFYLMIFHYIFIPGNSFPLGYLFFLIVFCLLVILFISHSGIESGICLLIARFCSLLSRFF